MAIGLAALALVSGCGVVVVDDAASGRGSTWPPPALVEADPGVREARPHRRVDRVPRPREAARCAAAACCASRARAATAPRADPASRSARGSCCSHRRTLPGCRHAQGRFAEASAKAIGRRARLPPRPSGHSPGRARPAAPKNLPLARDHGAGASVAVVGSPLSATPRDPGGVVVDPAPGRRRRSRTRAAPVVAPRHDGGPLIDAKGRMSSSRSRPTRRPASRSPSGSTHSDRWSKRVLDALAPCDGNLTALVANGSVENGAVTDGPERGGPRARRCRCSASAHGRRGAERRGRSSPCARGRVPARRRAHGDDVRATSARWAVASRRVASHGRRSS